MNKQGGFLDSLTARRYNLVGVTRRQYRHKSVPIGQKAVKKAEIKAKTVTSTVRVMRSCFFNCLLVSVLEVQVVHPKSESLQKSELKILVLSIQLELHTVSVQGKQSESLLG